MDNNQLTPALEDYLEAIFQISKMHKVARSMEIADMMKVKRSSVTIALRSLAEKGLINYQVRSFVTLTDEGMKIARCVNKRHNVLHDLFTKVLGLPQTTASAAACNMEHGMTSEVCRKMTALLSVLKKDTSSAHKLISDIEASAQKINCQNTCGFSNDTDTFGSDDTEVLTLNELQSGESGQIVKIIGVSSLKLRLQEMGFIRGQKVLVVKAAPLDDPIEVEIRSSHVSLRRGEAGMVLVKKL
ncbi:MAG: DtxR family transcriptional regulator [Fibrobacter sp.]|nr:DtxR family transcriptional regulator [Fibrobacter sp.]